MMPSLGDMVIPIAAPRRVRLRWRTALSVAWHCAALADDELALQSKVVRLLTRFLILPVGSLSQIVPQLCLLALTLDAMGNPLPWGCRWLLVHRSLI